MKTVFPSSAFSEQLQTAQAANHLKGIQDASLVTGDETIKTNAKLDVLIGIVGII